MESNNQNSDKQNGINKVTDIFSDFLNNIKGIGINIPYKIENKLINFCKTVYDIKDDPDTIKKYLDNFNHEKTIGRQFFESRLPKEKAKIESGEYYILPVFNNSFDIISVLLYSKKNKINSFKEKVKDWAADMLPGQSTQYNN